MKRSAFSCQRSVIYKKELSADCSELMAVSLRCERLPHIDGLFGQLPMLEALHHPIEIMRFRFELAYGGGSIGGDGYFLPGFRQHGDLDLAKRAWGYILFEEVHQLEIFVGHFEDRSPDLFSRCRSHAGEAAPPLRGTTAEFDRVFGNGGQHEELMLRSATFQLRGVEMVP